MTTKLFPETEESTEEIEESILALSDEDFANAVLPDEEDEVNAEPKKEESTIEAEEEEEETSENEEEEESEIATNVYADTALTPEIVDDKETDTDNTEKITTEETSVQPVNIDYKNAYEQIMAPFTANGKQLQAKSVEEVITLMQMGANYHKKMAGLKPSLKIVKLLEKHDLLDAEKINYLIDLNNYDTTAINKLVKDSSIDPMDIDVTTENEYKSKTDTVNDNELAIDEALETIQDTPTYNRTIKVLTEQWDDSSREIIAQNPQIINLINAQMADGTFDIVATAVAREKSFGKLQGLSDLEAYKTVGDILHNNNQLPGQQAKANTNNSVTKKKTTDKVKQQKKAVSSNKSRKTALPTEFNPLAMSDEEFNKVAAKYGLR